MKKDFFKLYNDLYLEFFTPKRNKNADGFFDVLDNTGMFDGYIIFIKKSLSLKRKIEVFNHELVHYIAKCKFQLEHKEEKLAQRIEKITERFLKILKKYDYEISK